MLTINGMVWVGAFLLVFMSGALAAVLVVGVVPDTMSAIVPTVDADPADSTAMPGLTPSQLYEMTIGEVSYERAEIIETWSSDENLIRVEQHTTLETVEVSSVVKVEVWSEYDRTHTGTGFFFAPGYVITANHVVDGHYDDYYGVRLSNGEGFYAEVLEVASGIDIAILLVPDLLDSHPPPIRYAEKAPVIGEWVMAMGYPWTNGFYTPPEFVLSVGTVSAYTSGGGGTSYTGPTIIANTDTGPGMSGTPVMNMWGEVVGIHVGASDNEPKRASLLPITAVIDYGYTYDEWSD